MKHGRVIHNLTLDVFTDDQLMRILRVHVEAMEDMFARGMRIQGYALANNAMTYMRELNKRAE